MKNLELESLGVVEMNNQEMNGTGGGWINPALIAVACSIVANTVDNFINGMYDEYQSRQNKTPVRGAGGSY